MRALDTDHSTTTADGAAGGGRRPVSRARAWRVLPVAAAGLLALSACGPDTSPTQADAPAGDDPAANARVVPVHKEAELRNADGITVGSVQLTNGDNGTEVHVQANGLPAGSHPVRLNSSGTCDFGAAPASSTPDPLAGTTVPDLVVADSGVGQLTALVPDQDMQALLTGDGSTVLVLGVPGATATTTAGTSPTPGAPASTGDPAPVACAAFGG